MVWFATVIRSHFGMSDRHFLDIFSKNIVRRRSDRLKTSPLPIKSFKVIFKEYPKLGSGLSHPLWWKPAGYWKWVVEIQPGFSASRRICGPNTRFRRWSGRFKRYHERHHRWRYPFHDPIRILDRRRTRNPVLEIGKTCKKTVSESRVLQRRRAPWGLGIRSAVLPVNRRSGNCYSNDIHALLYRFWLLQRGFSACLP